jgi:AraC-like DNA-binding protein
MATAATRTLQELMETLAKCDRASGADNAGGFYQSGLMTSAPGLLRSLGVDAEATALAAGVDPSVPMVEGKSISFTQLGRYMAQCVTDTGCNEFGLLVGVTGEFDRLGIVTQLMRTAPTLGAAIQDIAVNQMRNARGATTFLQRIGDETRLGYTVHQPGVEARDQISAAAIAFGTRIVRDLAPGTPYEVHLAQAAPADRRDLRRYETLLGARVYFDAEFSAVAIRNDALSYRLASANHEQRLRLLAEIRDYWPSAPPDICYLVFRTLIAQIAGADLSLAQTARQLAMHPRTLERRLDEEGTSFSMIREAARFEVARQLLSGTRLNMTAIAMAIGYTQPAAFSRTFRRWAGMSPRRYRDAGGDVRNVA